MTYASLMVHLAVGRPNAALLRCACDLAERLEAALIGVALCQPSPLIYGDGYLDGTLIEQERQELERELIAARQEFEQAVGNLALKSRWHAQLDFEPLAGRLAVLASGADLLITAAAADRQDTARHLDIGDLVLQAGRPVLLVPAEAGPLALDRALVAWRDSPGCRRAIADALPLLRRAGQVVVAAIVPELDRTDAQGRLDDVVAWLALHGVAARAQVRLLGESVSQGLEALAEDEGIDLIVAGAYGHSRLHEWALGGVTRDLLLPGHRCALLSH